MKRIYESQLWKSLDRIKLSSKAISTNCVLSVVVVTVVNLHVVCEETFPKEARRFSLTHIDNARKILAHRWSPSPVNIPQKALQLLPKTRDERKEIIRHKSITFFRKPKTAKGARFGCEVMRTIIHGFKLISDATSKFVLLSSKDGRESTTQNTRTTPTSKAKHFYATELSACAFSMDSLGSETKIPLLILISRNFFAIPLLYSISNSLESNWRFISALQRWVES